jgi:hypothetical protein
MDPPMTECVNRLIAKPPAGKREALIMFSYFSGRLGEIGQNNVAKLADARIVPVTSQKQASNGYPDEKASSDNKIRHLTPKQCYLGSSSTYGEIFEFVDFGNEANALLLKCGSKNEPTKLELAALACKEPARLLGIMQSTERYLGLLRTLADELPQLKRDKVLFKQMRQSKWLLGSTEIPANKEKSRQAMSVEDGADSDPEDMESGSIKQFQLAVPSQIVVVSVSIVMGKSQQLTYNRRTISMGIGFSKSR